MTSPDIVYKPEQVELDGRANDERRKENLICRIETPELNINNYNGKCVNYSAKVDYTTEQRYLMPNSVNANSGYVTQRYTHFYSSPEEVQPMINSQSVTFNNVMSNNANNGYITSRFTESRTEQLTPVTEHIIVNFQSTNNKVNESSTYINGQRSNLDRNEEYGRSDDFEQEFNINNKNMTAVHFLSSQPIIEVCDVINTFHPCPDSEYCDTDIVVIPTPQTVLKTRS